MDPPLQQVLNALNTIGFLFHGGASYEIGFVSILFVPLQMKAFDYTNCQSYVQDIVRRVRRLV